MSILSQTESTTLDQLLDKIPEQIELIRSARDSFLTDAILLGEIPAPTFGEKERIRLALDRFRENGLTDATIDEFGNASGILSGTTGESAILVMASHDDMVASHDDPA